MACAAFAALQNWRIKAPILNTTIFVAVICSALCAFRLARWRRKSRGGGAGWVILIFVGMMLFYGACFFAGCTAVFMRAWAGK
jgi:hypothetical protein